VVGAGVGGWCGCAVGVGGFEGGVGEVGVPVGVEEVVGADQEEVP
jgi:hypothetical protein